MAAAAGATGQGSQYGDAVSGTISTTDKFTGGSVSGRKVPRPTMLHRGVVRNQILCFPPSHASAWTRFQCFGSIQYRHAGTQINAAVAGSNGAGATSATVQTSSSTGSQSAQAAGTVNSNGVVSSSGVGVLTATTPTQSVATALGQGTVSLGD